MTLHGHLHGLDVALGGSGGGGGGEVLTPTPLAAGETNDYAPAGFSAGVGTLRLTPDTTDGSTLTGIVGQPDRTIPLQLVNLDTAAALTIKAGSSASAAGNRFISPDGADMKVAPGGLLSVWYDAATLAWRLLAPTPAPSSGLLWEWNQVDTSQFSSNLFLPTIMGSALTGAPALSVVAGADGPRLRLESVGAGQPSGALYVPLAAGQLQDIPEGSFQVQYEILSGIVSGNAYAGVAFLSNGDAAAVVGDVYTLFQMQVLQGGWSYQGYVTAGAVSLSGSTPSGITVPGTMNLSIRWNKPGGAQPRGFIQGSARGGQTPGTIGYFLSSGQFDQPFPANWNARTAAQMGQFGIWLLINTILNDPFVEYGALRILRGT